MAMGGGGRGASPQTLPKIDRMCERETHTERERREGKRRVRRG
jgi:hypothetical protein